MRHLERAKKEETRHVDHSSRITGELAQTVFDIANICDFFGCFEQWAEHRSYRAYFRRQLSESPLPLKSWRRNIDSEIEKFISSPEAREVIFVQRCILALICVWRAPKICQAEGTSQKTVISAIPASACSRVDQQIFQQHNLRIEEDVFG